MSLNVGRGLTEEKGFTSQRAVFMTTPCIVVMMISVFFCGSCYAFLCENNKT